MSEDRRRFLKRVGAVGLGAVGAWAGAEAYLKGKQSNDTALSGLSTRLSQLEQWRATNPTTPVITGGGGGGGGGGLPYSLINPVQDDVFAYDTSLAALKNKPLQSLSTFQQYVVQLIPSTSQTIQPTADVIPLSLKGFAGGSSDLLQLTASQRSQQKMWRVDQNGDLIMRANVSPSARIRVVSDDGLLNSSLLWRDPGGSIRFGDNGTDNNLPFWRFDGSQFNVNTPARLGDSSAPAAGSDADVVRQLRSRNRNVLVVESLSETQVNMTIPNTDTALKSYSLLSNQYTHLIVEGEGYISTTATSLVQDVNLKVRATGVQQGNTTPVRSQATIDKRNFTAKASLVQQPAATLDISVGAASADPNTTVFLNSMRVFAEV